MLAMLLDTDHQDSAAFSRKPFLTQRLETEDNNKKLIISSLPGEKFFNLNTCTSILFLSNVVFFTDSAYSVY